MRVDLGLACSHLNQLGPVFSRRFAFFCLGLTRRDGDLGSAASHPGSESRSAAVVSGLAASAEAGLPPVRGGRSRDSGSVGDAVCLRADSLSGLGVGGGGPRPIPAHGQLAEL
eukprot:scaffold18040_cov107-Isochrysis_galbana.AAC.3